MLFAAEGALREHLKNLNPHYADHAPELWRAGITSTDELADASIESLMQAGVTNRIHAETIKARSAGGSSTAGEPGVKTSLRDLEARFEDWFYLVIAKSIFFWSQDVPAGAEAQCKKVL